MRGRSSLRAGTIKSHYYICKSAYPSKKSERSSRDARGGQEALRAFGSGVDVG